MELQKRQVDDIGLTITSVNTSPNSLEIIASGPAGRFAHTSSNLLAEIVGLVMAMAVVSLTKAQ